MGLARDVILLRSKPGWTGDAKAIKMSNTGKTAGGKGGGKGAFAGLKRAFTKLVLLDSALKAFETADDRQKQAVIEVGSRAWLLAKLNPEKAKQVKSMLNPIPPTVKERLAELKALYDDGMITEQEFEKRKQELLNEV
jgi:hypothetical protein